MILPHQQNTARIAWLRCFRRELLDTVADIDREIAELVIENEWMMK